MLDTGLEDLKNERSKFEDKDKKCSHALHKIRKAITVNKAILYYKARLLYAERKLGNPEIQPASPENPTETFVKDVLSCSPENFPMTFDRFMNCVVQGTFEVANFQSQVGPMSDDPNSMNEVFDYLSHCEIPDGLVQEQKTELDRCYDERKQELMQIRDDGNSRTKRAEDKEAALLQVHKKFMMEQGEVCEVQQKLESVRQDNSRLRI